MVVVDKSLIFLRPPMSIGKLTGWKSKVHRELASYFGTPSEQKKTVDLIVDYSYCAVLPGNSVLYKFDYQSVQMWPAPDGLVLVDIRKKNDSSHLSSIEELRIDEIKENFFHANSAMVCGMHLCDAVDILYAAHNKFTIQTDERKCCQLLDDSWISHHKKTWFCQMDDSHIVVLQTGTLHTNREFKNKRLSKMNLSQQEFPIQNQTNCLVQRRNTQDVLILNTCLGDHRHYRFFYGNLESGKMRLLDSIPAVFSTPTEYLAWTRDFLFHAALFSNRVYVAVRIMMDACSVYELGSYAVPPFLLNQKWVNFCVAEQRTGLAFFLVFSSLNTDCIWCIKQESTITT